MSFFATAEAVKRRASSMGRLVDYRLANHHRKIHEHLCFDFVRMSREQRICRIEVEGLAIQVNSQLTENDGQSIVDGVGDDVCDNLGKRLHGKTSANQSRSQSIKQTRSQQAATPDQS